MSSNAAGVSQDRDRISLVGEINVLLRQPRVIMGFPFLGFFLAVGLTVMAGQTYEAESRFMPEKSGPDAARLVGLAAQFGVNIAGSTDPGESVEFYGELVQSRELLEDVATSRYRFATEPGGTDTISGTLMEIFEVEGRTETNRIRGAVGILRKTVTSSTGLRQAGIVTLETKAPWADLAVQINRRFLDLVGEFNLQRRQSQGAAERRFVEGRLVQIQGDVEAAEEALARFLEANRIFESSPELVFESDRLRSRLDLARQVHTGLAQAYEEARIAEVRNTPVVTIVDAPEGSARMAGSLVFNALLGLAFGGGFGLVLAFARAYAQRERAANPEVYRESRRLLRGFLGTLLLGRRKIPG